MLPLTSTVPPDDPVTFLTGASTTPAPPPPLSFGGKIPIPKMKRPLPSSGRGPIVLTLGSDGLYYPASSSSLLIKAETTTPTLASAAAVTHQQAASAAVMTASSTAAAATEPPAAAASYSAFRSYCSPMVAGLPTVSTPRGSEDVSFYVPLFNPL